MEKPDHHIFVCMSFRGLEPKGKCIKKNAPDLLGYLESELADRGLENVMVSSTGCLKLCEKGPMVVVYPEGYWYQGWKAKRPSTPSWTPWKTAARPRTIWWVEDCWGRGPRARALSPQTPTPNPICRGDPLGRPRVRS